MADSEHSAVLAPLLLVTKWSSSEADVAAVAELTGREWSELERELRALSARAHLSVGAASPGVARSDHDAYDQAVEAARAEALRETLDTAGLDGLTDLAESSEVPGHVGWTLAEVAGDERASELFLLLERDGKASRMASAWARAMVWLHSAESVERVTRDSESWPRDQQTAFLIAIPLGSQTLALLERVHEDVLKRSGIPARHGRGCS